MWKCQICDAKNENALICSRCGFNESKNYERYLSVALLSQGVQEQIKQETISELRKMGETYNNLYVEILNRGVRRFDLEEKSKKCYQKAALLGDAISQRKFASKLYWEQSATAADKEEAVQWLRKAAKQGDREAQTMLAGLRVDAYVDTAEAVQWCQQLAVQGDAYGQWGLGYRYFHGKGVGQDRREAVKWYQKAAEQGNDNGKRCLAECYYYGTGVQQNYEQAVYWWKQAEQGIPVLYYLANCYYEGKGTQKNLVKAVELYEKVANSNAEVLYPKMIAVARYQMSICYKYGYGVKKDMEKVAYWKKEAEKSIIQVEQDGTEHLLYLDEEIKKEAKREVRKRNSILEWL